MLPGLLQFIFHLVPFLVGQLQLPLQLRKFGCVSILCCLQRLVKGLSLVLECLGELSTPILFTILSRCSKCLLVSFGRCNFRLQILYIAFQEFLPTLRLGEFVSKLMMLSLSLVQLLRELCAPGCQLSFMCCACEIIDAFTVRHWPFTGVARRPRTELIKGDVAAVVVVHQLKHRINGAYAKVGSNDPKLFQAHSLRMSP
mmetsp:Transcript_34721/g.51596  ORF Transcript_34721/g.51596 Transcript_34721/m.51596 type:complete len:200 (+) Transcript_34721:845-1444(+)